MTDLSTDERNLLWGALVKVLHERDRLSERSIRLFNWPEWNWELTESEIKALERFTRLIEPQMQQ
jgi:hypothetical protein